MSDPGRFPEALRSSTVPRWSHRDPVEGGNPFAPEDSRHEVWHAATCSAQEALVRLDRDLDEAERAGPHPDPYTVRLVVLAESRFDIWAERVASIVISPGALADYEQWLTTYLARWIDYVAETCPRVDVGDTLQTRLGSRVQHWVAHARRTLESAEAQKVSGDRGPV